MVTLVVKAASLLAINAVCAVAFLSVVDQRQYAPWETESALYKIPRDHDAEVLLLGSSHAAIFGHCEDTFAAAQQLFGEDTTLIAKRGSGILQHRLLLREFYRRGNRADTIVYFVDAWGFYSDAWNETVPFIEEEPFDVSFAADLAAAGVSPNRLFHYVRSKFTDAWLQQKPRAVNKESCTRVVKKRSPFLVKQAMNHRYPERVDAAVRDRYLRELAALIETAQRHGAAVHLMTQPTLLDEHEHAADFRRALEQTIAPYGVPYTDHATAMREPEWFHDHDHLNDAGIRRYAQAFVKPLL